MLRRGWNLMHWTLGRAVFALAIANIFIGFYLSHVKHSHIAAQAVVLGALFIIYMLKNDIEYMLIKHTPAEEERLMAAAIKPGSLKYWQQNLDASAVSCPALTCLKMVYTCASTLLQVLESATIQLLR